MSRYRWPSFRQLVRDFFADLRDLIAELKRREGQAAFVLVAVLTLGEAMLFVDRKRRGLPGKVRALLVPTAMMLGVAAFGAVGMRLWC